MRKILILTGRYLPGYKDGGPLRTIVNITDALGDDYEFHISCLDRDHGDAKAYPNIVYDEWNTVGKAKVWYIKPGNLSFELIKKLSVGMDVIYVCGFYNDYGYKTLILNRLGKLNKVPVVVAAMGTFSKGALSHKFFKKKIFIDICKIFGLFKWIKWSVTSELELEDVKQNIGKNAECIIAEDLPRTNIPGIKYDKKNKKLLKVVFLSRICSHKNLMGAIKSLEGLKCNVMFTIYGPIEDSDYWKKCKTELDSLPNNIAWSYEGDVSSDIVQKKLQEHDIFLLPTKGENYGHVIFESLSVGCIPVISDQTPWKIIKDRCAGYVLPITVDMEMFTDALDTLSKMEITQRRQLSERGVEIAKDKVEQSKRETGYRIIFG